MEKLRKVTCLLSLGLFKECFLSFQYITLLTLSLLKGPIRFILVSPLLVGIGNKISQKIILLSP